MEFTKSSIVTLGYRQMGQAAVLQLSGIWVIGLLAIGCFISETASINRHSPCDTRLTWSFGFGAHGALVFNEARPPLFVRQLRNRPYTFWHAMEHFCKHSGAFFRHDWGWFSGFPLPEI